MRLKITKSKNASSLYVIKSTYKDGKNSSKIVEKLGTYAELSERLGGQDPIEWAKAYIAQLNEKEKEDHAKVMVQFSPTKPIDMDKQRTYNLGYLFLQQIYYALGLPKICEQITQKYPYEFDLNCVLSRLIYGRILFPASKLSTYKLSSTFLEKPAFELQHVYRALEVIAKETDFIQAQLYKNSLKLSQRNSGILYYDCTNYFFEIEQEGGIKQYGASKEHRPNPIVQMGLFMDGDGIPLAFCVNSGNTNEQLTMKPLEQKILKDFNLSKFIVCTDAGLASNSNRIFNDQENRAFITTQSIKKLKKYLMDWALSETGWRCGKDNTLYDLSALNEEEDYEKIFFKERWVKENGLEQKMIVTFSLKYKEYQRHIRQSQIERALKAMEFHPDKIQKSNQNDYKRFVKRNSFTAQGQAADQDIYCLDEELIAQEEKFDGFYAIGTNLEDDAPGIIKVSNRRWEIEDCFRVMKTEFKARPVYLQRDERIAAHFTTCFLALVIFRFLEKKLDERFTACEIIHGLREMNALEILGDGFVPVYTRNEFTDTLHAVFGFRTDYQINTNRHMRKVIAMTKS
jgi:transposase